MPPPSPPPPPDSSPAASYASLHRAAQNRRHRRLLLRGMIGLIVYIVAWDFTFFRAEGWITPMLHECFDPSGPSPARPASIHVFITACPAPFIVKAEWSVTGDPYPRGGETVWYFATPLGVYEIAVVRSAWFH